MVRSINLAAYPEVVEVAPGQTLRVYLAFNFIGKGYRETLYAALWKGYIFGHPDETAGAKRGFDIPDCMEESTISGSEVYVPITIPNRPGETFGLYVKVGPVECEPADRYKDCVKVIEKAPPGYTLTVRVEPLGAGWVTKEPDKAKYSYGEIVKLTAHPGTGWRFSYWDCDGEWASNSNPINFKVLADHMVTAHFTEEVPTANFVVSDLIIEPTELYVGEEVSISATVTNIGNIAGDYELVCEIVGVTVLTGAGFLSPGESETGSLHFIPTEPGSYQVLLNGLAGSFVATEMPIPQVTVYLKNPPSGANKWQMLVTDWDFTKALEWGLDAHDNIEEPAIFDIPIEWKLPLKVSISIYESWLENGEWHGRELYRVQSYRPNKDYKEIFLKYGNYDFNVATEQFEKI